MPAAPYDSILHSPVTIGGATIRNRLYRAPVLEGAGDGDDAPSATRSTSSRTRATASA